MDDFDRQAWRDLLGEYITTLLTEPRETFNDQGLADRRIGVGVARGDWHAGSTATSDARH
jgi:hypothetical protein